MKKTNTKRALLASLLSVLLCMSMLVGTTFAWFTDSVTSGKNTLTAGNLDVELSYLKNGAWADVEGQSDVFNPTALWEPGYSEVVYLKVENKGSLALNYRLAINRWNEEIGKTKDGADIRLADFIRFDIIELGKDANGNVVTFADRAAAIAAATNAYVLSEALDTQSTYAHGTMTNGTKPFEKGAVQYYAIVAWMPTDVDNAANHDGVHIPSIDLGVTLTAAQATFESDSFGADYDAGFDFPAVGAGTAQMVPGESAVDVTVKTNAGANIGSGNFPSGALSGDTVSMTITKSDRVDPNANFTLTSDQTSQSFDIDVQGLKANNDVPVKVQLRVAEAGTSLSNVVVYHYDETTGVTEGIIATYNPHDGYVTFETTSFSPFYVVYDKEYKAPVYVEGVDDVLPQANVVKAPQFENTDLPWGSYGSWSPTAGLDSELEAAYIFSCAQTLDEAQASKFANWYCDFYVKLDKDLGENQIFLGGNYGSFGWIGFHNGDLTLEANTEIPLLGSVTTNPWTYTDVVQSVKEFTCGVGDVSDALAGATFTVMLRLTNPENEAEFYNVQTITHTFTGTPAVSE